jgi:hypothetical protein
MAQQEYEQRIVEELRAKGWLVGSHNDYTTAVGPRTYWMFTHSCGVWIEGDGATDLEALMTCAIQSQSR